MLEESRFDGPADLVVAIQKEFRHRGDHALNDFARVVHSGQLVEPRLKLTRRFVAIQSYPTVGILTNTSKKISLDQCTCFCVFKPRVDAIPCLVGESVQ